jgi:hypothetical protein
MATQIINHPIRNTAPSVKTTKSRARTGHGQEGSQRQYHRRDLHIVEIDRAERSAYGSSLSLVERVQRAQCDSKKAR